MTPLRTDGRVPLYRRVLGEAWDLLPAPLQTMHDVQSERTADGVAVVERGSGLLARLVAFVIGFPPAGTDIPSHCFVSRPTGPRILATQFRRPRVFERAGARARDASNGCCANGSARLNFVMALVCESERLRFVIRRWSVCGIPLPRALAPRGNSYEFVEAGRFHFHVEIAHPFTGLIVRYRGWLVPQV